MTILDRANAFIGHEQDVDEGYETTMRRNAFIAGFKEAMELVKGMREAQKKEQQLHMKLVPTIDGEDSFDFVERLLKLESEVDELIDEIKNFTATKKCSLVYDMDGELLRREAFIALAAIEWADDNPKWIRSIDEIPPIGVDVLTRVKRGSGDVIYQVDRRSEYEWVNLCHYDKVTHWMPIVGPKED